MHFAPSVFRVSTITLPSSGNARGCVRNRQPQVCRRTSSLPPCRPRIPENRGDPQAPLRSPMLQPYISGSHRTITILTDRLLDVKPLRESRRSALEVGGVVSACVTFCGLRVRVGTSRRLGCVSPATSSSPSAKRYPASTSGRMTHRSQKKWGGVYMPPSLVRAPTGTLASFGSRRITKS